MKAPYTERYVRCCERTAVSHRLLLDYKKGQIRMKGIMIGVVAVAAVFTFFLYCCVRVGAQEDRWMEEMEWKDRQDGRKSG